MKDFSAFLDMGRYKNWAHKIGSEDLSCHSTPHQLQAQSDSFLHSTLSSFQGVLKVSSVWLNFIEVDREEASVHGKCQFIDDTTMKLQ